MLLMAVGCLAIHRAEVLAESSGRLARQQMVWGVMAASALFLAAVPNYLKLMRYSYAALGVSLLLLGAVYFTTPVNGAHR